MPSQFPLPGPPPTSLLGFLTLLGLLRSLDESKPEWHSRLSWKNLVPQLHITENVDCKVVVEAVVYGLTQFGEKLRFPAPNPGVEIDEFRQWQEKMDPEAVTAVGSDACPKKSDKTRVDTTPLCMMFGAGRQEFLARLEQATSICKSDVEGVQAEISNALFARWSYGDSLPKIAFRWDPTEYRPHALQSKDPKKEIIQTVNGANRLAAIGFTTYECVPTTRGLSTVSCMPGGARIDIVLWPIWSEPISLAEVKVVMSLPQVKKTAGSAVDPVALEELQVYGINGIMRTALFWDDRFKNVRVAELVT